MKEWFIMEVQLNWNILCKIVQISTSLFELQRKSGKWFDT